MKEINEFDILENTEQSVIDRLSVEFPPDDAEEKEKVFRMSEEKFNKANNTYKETDEQVVSGVEVYKKPLWQKCLSAAAAAAILIGGTAGGIKAYKHFTDTPAPTEEEVHVAPFGDFAALDYKLCDYDADTMQKVIIRNTPDEYSYFELFSGSDITQEKREKLAGFFNNYDYGESLTEAEHLQAAINKALKDIDEENETVSEDSVLNDTNSDHFINDTVEVPVIPETSFNATDEDIPYFIYNSGSEVRAVKIYDVGEFGVLNYSHFSYAEENGELVMTDNEVSTDAWKIDYDLFKSTINDILNITEEEPDYCYKIAPFGDFAEMEYQLCDFDADWSLRTIDKESVEHAQRLGLNNIVETVSLPTCVPISHDHREKLAELFNNYNFESHIAKSYVYDPESDLIILNKNGETIELDSMDSEDHSDITHCNRFRSNADAMHLSPINPYMIYETDDEVRFLSFFKYDDYGAMNYCRIKFEDIDGTRHLFNDTLSMTSYEIDYDYFVDTMEAILEDREYTIRKGASVPTAAKEEAVSGSCPFDFTAHEFIRPDPEKRGDTFFFVSNGETSFNLYNGNIIPLEKRQKLAEFFNSCNWEEIYMPDHTPKYSGNLAWEDTFEAIDNRPVFLRTYERFCFYSLSDGEFNMLKFDGDQDTLTVTSFMIVPKYDISADDPEQVIRDYIAVDENLTINDTTKCYKIDFSFFLSNIKEILGDDFCDIGMEPWGFFGKEWSVTSDENNTPAELSETDKREICSILKKGCWKEESRDSKIISEEEEKELYKNTLPPESDRYVVMTGKLYDYNYVICIEEYAGKILAKYYDCASNISGNDYTEEIYTYSCDDTSLISSVKEYLKS